MKDTMDRLETIVTIMGKVSPSDDPSVVAALLRLAVCPCDYDTAFNDTVTLAHAAIQSAVERAAESE